MSENTLSASSLLKGALIFTAAISWNNAIKDSIDILYPLPRDRISANIAYAMVVTIIIVVIILIYNTVVQVNNHIKQNYVNRSAGPPPIEPSKNSRLQSKDSRLQSKDTPASGKEDPIAISFREI